MLYLYLQAIDSFRKLIACYLGQIQKILNLVGRHLAPVGLLLEKWEKNIPHNTL